MVKEIFVDDLELDVMLKLYVRDLPLLVDSDEFRSWNGQLLTGLRDCLNKNLVKLENNAYDLSNAGVLYLINKDIV